MVTTRSNSNDEAKQTFLLPDMWVTDLQISSCGRKVNTHYMNVRTRQKFYSKPGFYKHFRRIAAELNEYTKSEMWLNRETAEEEKDHICSRCKETGHNCLTCPYPIIYKTNPYAGTTIRRCSRCHYLGHNARTCPDIHN